MVYFITVGEKKQNEYSAKKYKCLYFMQGKLSFPYLLSLDLFSGYYGKKEVQNTRHRLVL